MAEKHTIALAGNPNTGKSTVFNALTGAHQHVGNWPGKTVEKKEGTCKYNGSEFEVVDLPGTYSLTAYSLEEIIARDYIIDERPDLVVIVVDSANLERNLFLASQILELGLPVVVALNMVDLARRAGIKVDPDALSKELDCPVLPVVARSGQGVAALKATMERIAEDPDRFAKPQAPQWMESRPNCPQHLRYDWAEKVAEHCVIAPPTAVGHKSESIDRFLTHRVTGVAAFLGLMLVIFYLIFSLATVPMGLIDGMFSALGAWLAAHLPAGDLRSLLVEGVIGGVGGVLVFLPQVCILFLFFALLEDTGYMARAAFVMDRLMQRVGLPGKAFVPMLSAHACAVPGIMCTRMIEDRRDRLATILVLPMMTCSARLPVFAMVTALLFPANPLYGAMVFTFAYLLGILAAIGTSYIFKRTILPGKTHPLVLELPSYKLPSLRTAFYLMLDRARIFLRKAGTVILAVSVVIWWLANYPKIEIETAAANPGEIAGEMTTHAVGDATLLTEPAPAGQLNEQVLARRQLAHSFLGRMGQWIEPVVAPLGFDWQIGVGILSSLMARELIIPALSILNGLGEENAAGETSLLIERLRLARRPDGSPLFTLPVCISLLIFYVLAMQCLPTLAVTRRETGSWRWPAFQFCYLGLMAYGVALVCYQALTALGVS